MENLNTNTLNFDVSHLTAQAKQELVDFYQFLLQRYTTSPMTSEFTPTQLEPSDTPSVYTGPPLSLEDMEEAICVEAGKHT
jgi:hypothetical protein